MLGKKSALTEAQINALFTVAADTTDTTCSLLFSNDATGDLVPKTNANLTFDAVTAALGAKRLTLVSDDVATNAATFDVSGGFTDLYGNQDHFKFNVVDTYAANPGNSSSLRLSRVIDGSGTYSNSAVNMIASLSLQGTNTFSGGASSVTGISASVQNLGGVPGGAKTVPLAYGAVFTVQSVFSDAIITDAIALKAICSSTASGVLTNAVGLNVEGTQTGTGDRIINWKGIVIEASVATTTTNSYAIYSAGTGAGDKWLCGGDFALQGDFTHTGTNIGFFSATAVAQRSGYTQTYATADKTHANMTSADLSLGAGANGYATAGEAASVQTEVNALRADLIDLKQFVNSIFDDLQTLGLYA